MGLEDHECVDSEFNFANVVNYSDLANLMAPRTEIEFFNGPHTIHGIGTFAFLRRQLRWPE